MTISQFKEIGGRFRKKIISEGLPKERIKIFDGDGNSICDIFGSGEITIIFDPIPVKENFIKEEAKL